MLNGCRIGNSFLRLRWLRDGVLLDGHLRDRDGLNELLASRLRRRLRGTRRRVRNRRLYGRRGIARRICKYGGLLDPILRIDLLCKTEFSGKIPDIGSAPFGNLRKRGDTGIIQASRHRSANAANLR